MIDVVIPVYNQFHLVSQCVDAMLAQEAIGTVRIVDDGSTDRNLTDYYRIMQDKVDICQMPRNSGFIHAVNAGMKVVETEYAVIVNSDTIPLSRDAVYRLARSMDVNNANVAGAKLLFMPGSEYGRPWTIQHAGVGFDPDGRPYHPFMNLHRDTKAANVPKRVTAVTGAVFGVRVGEWRRLEGFDDKYGRGVYEDVDYCLRAKKVAYEPRSEWLHKMHGSQTNENNLFDAHDENLETFMRTWGTMCDEEIYYGV